MNILEFLDHAGTFIFAVVGALRGLKHQLDVLGVLILAVFTGLGGGIMRDLILDINPPLAFQNESYFVICTGAALLTIFWGIKVLRWWKVVQVIDAVGLAVFSAQGALLAAKSELGPIGVVFLGTLTAVGGGVVRDLFVREIPAILVREFYATAAALGALVLWIGKIAGLPNEVILILGMGTTLTLRLLGMLFHWHLPRVKNLDFNPPQDSES